MPLLFNSTCVTILLTGRQTVDYILFAQIDDTLVMNANQDEVKDVMWISLADIGSAMNGTLEDKRLTPDTVTPWFKLIYNTFLKTWTVNLDHLDHITDHTTINRF